MEITVKHCFLYEKVLGLIEKRVDWEHRDYADGLTHLAGVQSSLGQYQEALKGYIQVVEIDKKTIGNQHPLHGVHLNNLASTYEILGEYTQAMTLYEQSLEIVREQVGEMHPHFCLLRK